MWELSSRLAVATKYKYRYGKAYDLNFYTADGTAFDYMAGVQKVGSMERWVAERGVCGGGAVSYTHLRAHETG